MTRRNFVFELLVEEMPAGIIAAASRDFAAGVEGALVELSITFESLQGLSTSRRLGVVITGLDETQEEKEQLVTGPPWASAFDNSGAPTKAAEGFAKSKGVEVSDLEEIATDKGPYAGIRLTSRGQETSLLLPDMVLKALSSLRFPKEMLWGDGIGPFVRPVHGVMALFGEEIIPISFMGVDAGRVTVAHRQRGSAQITVPDAGSYVDLLRVSDVIVLDEERRTLIHHSITKLAEGAEVPQDDPLLNEWIYMVEYPGVISGAIGDSVFDLPFEVLDGSLRHHQKAILLKNGEGKAIPRFLAVMDRRDDEDGIVRQGQEWVIQARLDDASFFYSEDRKTLVADRVETLKGLTFHDRIGNYLQKTGRIQELSEFVARQLNQNDLAPLILQAAKLSKADLTTNMVGEFPELQGVMGGLYAKHEGLDERVWRAIYQHYQPKTLEDCGPEGPVGAIVSIADRVDTITSLFAAGEVPTGSRDPFGLRRIANGMLQILFSFDYDIDLDVLFTRALQLLETTLNIDYEIHGEIRLFLSERAAHIMTLRGYREDEIRAVLEVRSSHPVDALARLKAIRSFRDKKEFLNFILAFKRVRNILGESPIGDIDPQCFVEDEEKALYAEFVQAKEFFFQCLHANDYEGALTLIGSLSPVLDTFFDKVMVMVDDEPLKKNRLALLGHLYREFLKIAQFSNLQVEKSQYRSM